MDKELKKVISRWTTIVALCYMAAAFYRVFPPFETKEIQPEHVPYGCMDYPICAIQSRTSPPKMDIPPSDNQLSKESELELYKEAKALFEKEENPPTATVTPEYSDLDTLMAEEYYTHLADSSGTENQTRLQNDTQALTSTSQQPHRQFRRAVEFHSEMEPERESDDEQHYPHAHWHSDAEYDLQLQPYEGPGLCLALRVTFVISSSLLGLSLLIGNECGGPSFFRGWLIGAGASTALDVGLLIAVAVTEGTNDCTIFHYIFLVMRVFSFCIVYNRMISFEIIRRGDTRPILPQCRSDDDDDDDDV